MYQSQIEKSNEQINRIRNEKRNKFISVRFSHETGAPSIYPYGSLAIKQHLKELDKTKEPFSIEYQVNFSTYQYDLELFIFLNYHELWEEEKKLSNDDVIVSEYGPTGFDREQHLLNAMSIRWPEKKLPSGQKIGNVLITPWLEDFAYGVSNYTDTVMYGGGGQGKTYGPLAMMCMIFDYFIYTQSGAQCSYSTVSEKKLESSTWAYVNKIYPVSTERRKFSHYAGKAIKKSNYTFKRANLNGKVVENGGKFEGVLLQKGMKNSQVIDKLTGSHDCIARIYLLDEAQSTDSAPMDARGNLFIHPKYKWFIMSGNYESTLDLLGLNVEPNDGWASVNESTHIYEGTLKSFKNPLGIKSCVIHYNNDLSPAITDPALAKIYKHLPNKEKRDALYPNPESKKSYAYKRFWIGFKFEAENKMSQKILDQEFLDDYKAHEDEEYVGEVYTIGSFDPAPASVDRNILTTLKIGINKKTGYPLVKPGRIYCLPVITSQLTYNKETANRLTEIIDKERIASGNIIVDFTYRHALIEMLSNKGIICHYIIYNEGLPKKMRMNPISKVWEDVIELESIKTFAGTFEKKATMYAHEKLRDRITLGAYAMRMFIEKGGFKKFDSSVLATVEGHNGFEKEFLNRSFTMNNNNIMSLDLKSAFRKLYGFSPDISDTFFQAFYFIYAILGIRPHKKSLGTLSKVTKQKKIDNYKRLWNTVVEI